MSRRHEAPVTVGREEVRLAFWERRALGRVFAQVADELHALDLSDQPTLEGYTLRATEHGYRVLLTLMPTARAGTELSRIGAKILDALDRYAIRRAAKEDV